MSSGKQYLMSEDGTLALQTELEYMKTEKRTEVAEEIKMAKSFGDLSENSEYDEAKNKQAVVEARIQEIEGILKNVVVIDESEVDLNVVKVGRTVTVKDLEFKEDCEYTITGSTEADSSDNKISDESPLGKALLGHKKGQTVKVKTPSGELKYKIIEIRK